MSYFMKRLAILSVIITSGYASDNNMKTSIEEASNVIEGQSNLVNVRENNVINNLWNNTNYTEIRENKQQNNCLLEIAEIIANRSACKLSRKANYAVKNRLYYFMNSLPDNKIRILSRDNIISLLNNANPLQCHKKSNVPSGFTRIENCDLCNENKIIDDLYKRLNKKQYINYGSINQFTEYLIKNNRIFQDIGSQDLRYDTHTITGINKMPYYDAIYHFMDQIYDANENKIKYCDTTVLTIVKKCLLIPYLHKFLNDENTNDLYYRITHYKNGDYDVSLFLNNLSEYSDNNSLILLIEVYNNNISCKMREFHKLQNKKLESYRQSRKNTEEQK